ncbi:uncharacterized protein LOC143233657 [Tachypleus tridentatus]|uniref:uncharacterized protein LOC143233657 n=1 Tax=Tachypleus tridentatus TaxID=6853 RepID=UPI003FD4FEA9
MDLTKNKNMVQKRRSLGDRNRRRKKKYNKLSLQNGRLDLVSSSITNCRLTRPIGIYSRAKTSDHVLRAAEEDSGLLVKRFPDEELHLPKTYLVDSEKSKNRFRDRKLNSGISRECQTTESGTVTGDFHTPVKCDQMTPQPKLRLSRQPVSGITQTTSSSSSTSKSNATDDIPLDDIIRRLQDSLEIQNEALFPNTNWEAKLKRELQETYYYV